MVLSFQIIKIIQLADLKPKGGFSITKMFLQNK